MYLDIKKKNDFLLFVDLNKLQNRDIKYLEENIKLYYI